MCFIISDLLTSIFLSSQFLSFEQRSITSITSLFKFAVRAGIPFLKIPHFSDVIKSIDSPKICVWS